MTSGGESGSAGGSSDPRSGFAIEGAAGAVFRYCPSCASPRIRSERGRRWTCPDCGFEYFHNVAAAAGIVIDVGGKVLFLVRAREPGLGRIALPGGFVEPGERAEAAALRECREELGWAPERLEFLASFPNNYQYKGVPYWTCDVFFRARPAEFGPDLIDLDLEESSEFRLEGLEGMPWELVAFESTRRALRSHFGLPSDPR